MPSPLDITCSSCNFPHMADISIRVSSLTASSLGLKPINASVFSEQAYLMLGERCVNGCLFCAQSVRSDSNGKFLSRVSWPSFPIDAVLESFKAKAGIFRKICFQVVSQPGYYEEFHTVLQRFQKELTLPVSASIDIRSFDEAERLFDAGLTRLGMAIDAASAAVYARVKQSAPRNRNTFDEMKKLMIRIADAYPGKVATHLIAGLGETDRDIALFAAEMSSADIILALFAFTPVPRTPFSSVPRIPLERYRKIQLMTSLIRELGRRVRPKSVRVDDLFSFNDNDLLTGFKNISSTGLLSGSPFSDGAFLMTSGCPYCNRPFYNDTPRDPEPYNYSVLPTRDKAEYWLKLLLNL